LIVIANDAPSIAKVKAVAEENGYEVRVADHADEFKDTLDSFDPAVIVLDIVMPEVDGIELIGWLAEHGSTARIVVLADNALYARLARSLCDARGLILAAGSAKPIQMADLEAALARS